jgi:ATP-dependent Lon protease
MTRLIPLLPLRDIVVFPQRIVPLFVGREKSVEALEAAMADDKELFLVAQLDPAEDDPAATISTTLEWSRPRCSY